MPGRARDDNIDEKKIACEIGNPFGKNAKVSTCESKVTAFKSSSCIMGNRAWKKGGRCTGSTI